MFSPPGARTSPTAKSGRAACKKLRSCKSSPCVGSSADGVRVFYPPGEPNGPFEGGGNWETPRLSWTELGFGSCRFDSTQTFDRARAPALTSHDGQQQQWGVQRGSGGPVPGGRQGGPSQDSAGHRRGWRSGSKGPKVHSKFSFPTTL